VQVAIGLGHAGREKKARRLAGLGRKEEKERGKKKRGSGPGPNRKRGRKELHSNAFEFI
jgi:hypothetical protein